MVFGWTATAIEHGVGSIDSVGQAGNQVTHQFAMLARCRKSACLF